MPDSRSGPSSTGPSSRTRIHTCCARCTSSASASYSRSPANTEILRQFGFDNFIVSPGHVADKEIEFWSRTAYPTFLAMPGRGRVRAALAAPTINVRIDGLDSGKPGVKYGELDRLCELLNQYGRELECFEAYCGSGNTRDEMVSIIQTTFTIFT